MATLTTLTALINSKIRNKTPKVLKVEHADVEQAIVNELYSATVRESYNGSGLTNVLNLTAPNLTTVGNTPNLSYTLDISKTGNKVFVNGFITHRANNTNNITGDVIVLTNSEFNSEFTPTLPIPTSLAGVTIFIASSSISLGGVITVGQTARFNFFYTTNG